LRTEDIDIVPQDDAEEIVYPHKHVLFYTLDKKKSIIYLSGASSYWRISPYLSTQNCLP
jgi:hypothetical protein